MQTPDCFKVAVFFYNQEMGSCGSFYIPKIIDLDLLKDMSTSVSVISYYYLHHSMLNMSWLLKKSLSI